MKIQIIKILRFEGKKNMLFYIKYKINDTNNFKYESNELLKLNNKYVKSSSLMKSIVCITQDIMSQDM